MTHENIATRRNELVRDGILKYIYLETKKTPTTSGRTST
jgi:hypothetical protein